MAEDLWEIVEKAREINDDLISRYRLELLWALSELGEDGATTTQLKGALSLNDGALYSNLKKMGDMGVLKSESAILDGKELQLWSITPEGELEWKRISNWLCKLLNCGGDSCERHE